MGHHHGGRLRHYGHIAAVREINQRSRSGGYVAPGTPARRPPKREPDYRLIPKHGFLEFDWPGFILIVVVVLAIIVGTWLAA